MNVFSSGSSFLLVDSACFWGAFRHLRRAAATFSGKSGKAFRPKRQRRLEKAAALFADGGIAFCERQPCFLRKAAALSRRAVRLPGSHVLPFGERQPGQRLPPCARPTRCAAGRKGKLFDYYFIYQAVFPFEVYGQTNFELRSTQVGDAVISVFQAIDSNSSNRLVILLENF